MPQDTRAPILDWIKELTSGSEYPATFGPGGNAGVEDATNANKRYPTWIQIVGAGTTVLVCEDGSTATLVCSGGEVYELTVKTITSTTSTRVRVGAGTKAPPATAGGVNVQAVNLAGGDSSVSGVLPGPNLAAYANEGAAHTGGFTATIGYMHKINVSGATFAYTLPAISATNDGQKLAIVNVGAGTTATIATANGTDAIGNALTSTAATAAGPTGGNVKVYVADNTLKSWLTGL